MRVNIKLAVRDWDYLTPLALGDVRCERIDLELTRVGTLPDWAADSNFDAGEVSFGKYVQAKAAGSYSLSCIPHFMMRGFRHRCILAHADSPMTRLEDLAGKKIGVTGWPDSGNTWTRALLRRAGVAIQDVHWFVGRLTADYPVQDRLGRFAKPGHIEATPGGVPLTDLLESRELDAIFTPFLPPSFLDDTSRLRFLVPDFRSEELRYFREVGYVPGIHLLGVRPEISNEHPWIQGELSEAIEESARAWASKRLKYAETTPWLIDDIVRTHRDLPADWNVNGFAANEKMIDDFAGELFEQGIVDQRLNAEALFGK